MLEIKIRARVSNISSSTSHTNPSVFGWMNKDSVSVSAHTSQKYHVYSKLLRLVHACMSARRHIKIKFTEGDSNRSGHLTTRYRASIIQKVAVAKCLADMAISEIRGSYLQNFTA